MRDYTRKAKRVDNGEWVKGFYFCMEHKDGRHVHHFIIPLGADLSLGTPIEKIQVEIDPNTICDPTGLTDKNGNKIWENDIVNCPLEECYGKVIWNENEALFAFAVLYEDGMFEEEYLYDFENYIEVIGNIFDNTDLLKGE